MATQTKTNGDAVSFWLTRCNRDTAERLLLRETHGTFLVRPASCDDQYVLSVRVHANVRHCIIEHANGRFGFTRQDCVFDSFDTFLMYYRRHSMLGHNSAMDVTLSRPLVLSPAQLDLMRPALGQPALNIQCDAAVSQGVAAKTAQRGYDQERSSVDSGNASQQRSHCASLASEQAEPEVVCSFLRLLEAQTVQDSVARKMAVKLLKSFARRDDLQLHDAVDVAEEYGLLVPSEAELIRTRIHNGTRRRTSRSSASLRLRRALNDKRSDVDVDVDVVSIGSVDSGADWSSEAQSENFKKARSFVFEV